MKKVLSAILVAVMMFSFVTIGVSAAGDTMATATKISFGTKYTGTINASNTRDFYKIVLAESGKLTINTTVFMNVYMGLYGENGENIINRSLSIAYTAMNLKNEVIDVYLTSGTYYLDFNRHVGSSNNIGEYNITFTFESANESFKEVQGGSNESLNKAFGINLNKKYYGQMAKNENKDFYKLEISNKTKIKIDLNVFPYVYCSICDENGKVVYDAGMLGYNYNMNISKEIELESGIYYLCFSKSNGTCGNYNFTISEIGVTVPEEPTTPSEPETPSTPENPEEPGSSSGEEPFFITILVAIWEFLVNVFMFLFGWILM